MFAYSTDVLFVPIGKLTNLLKLNYSLRSQLQRRLVWFTCDAGAKLSAWLITWLICVFKARFVQDPCSQLLGDASCG